MLRQQKMTVKRAKADHRQTELDLDVARMSVTEFKEGTLFEALKELNGTGRAQRVDLGAFERPAQLGPPDAR